MGAARQHPHAPHRLAPRDLKRKRPPVAGADGCCRSRTSRRIELCPGHSRGHEKEPAKAPLRAPAIDDKLQDARQRAVGVAAWGSLAFWAAA